VKINKRYIQLDTNVFIDLILVTQKATCQFTDILGELVSPSWKIHSDLYSKSTTNNHRYNYYMENKMTSLETYLCAFKMFHAKIYLWHLQAFLISGAKIKKINYILIEV
jgi:hypothetical protein